MGSNMSSTASGDLLPKDVWAEVFPLTTPKDACRLSAVDSTFRDAAESDGVWERFLPSDYRRILSRADDASLMERFESRKKKDLYLHICDHPVLLDAGRNSFSLEKASGKKCFMISARELYICWGDTPQYWQWNSTSASRFPEVAELRNVCWLEIKGRISLTMLSPSTNYAVYLVFTTSPSADGFGRRNPTKGHLLVNGQESPKRLFYLTPMGRRPNNTRIQRPRRRDDGWMEVELGEHFVGNDEYGDLGDGVSGGGRRELEKRPCGGGH